MTISQESSRTSSASGLPRPFHIPARPSSRTSQDLPAGEKIEESANRQALLTQISEQDTRSSEDASFQAEPSAQQQQAPSQAFFSAQPALTLKTVGKRRSWLSIALAVLAILVVLGGLLAQQLLNGSNATQANSMLNFSSSGPYAQFPLSASQINAIRHLSGHMKYRALASLYVSHMSLDDEIGQMIMVEYYEQVNKNQASGYDSDLDYMIHTLHVGGVIMYEAQMATFNQTKGDIAKMQQRANIPLLISTDEEGGPYVQRLNNIYGYRMDATQIEETGDVNVAKQQGLKVSQQLKALGINVNLTPDVDVNQVNGYDMVTRTFGNTPAQVIKFAGPYLQAMQGNGTIGCLKHFPGLGAAEPDAHKTLPVVNSTKQQIYAIDLAPFKAFIQSPDALLNPGMIMPTDVLMPAIDPKYPAELSYTFMTDILRKQFGYDGVVLTDALYMAGITDTWSMDTAAVMAIQAGDDMLLGATGTQQTIDMMNAIKQALRDGQLTKARIDESVTRIIALKMQYHLMPTYVPGV
jgi:beta-N-acetylhexosaminidase